MERHGFKDNEIIVIRSTSFPIKAELLTFELYLNVDRLTNLEVTKLSEITLTTSARVNDLKEEILKLDIFTDLMPKEHQKPDFLRI